MAKQNKLNLYTMVACTATMLAASWVLAVEDENCIDQIEDEALRVPVAFQLAGFVDNCVPEPPEALLGVRFPTAEANLGNCILPCETILPPVFEYEGNATLNVTIMIMNKDYPSATTPVLANYLLFLAVNVNVSTIGTYDFNTIVAPWINVNPSPGSGKQRIVAYMSPQVRYINPRNDSLVDLNINRSRFNMTEMSVNYTLGIPLAGNFWRTYVPKNYEKYCGIQTIECCARTSDK